MKQSRLVSKIGKAYVAILLVIFGGIVLHAPLTVGLGVIWPNQLLLIKSWKEIIMLVAGVMALYLLYRHKQFKLLKDPVIVAIEVYTVLHLALLVHLPQGSQSALAGLAVDLRYILFFVLVYVALKLYPQYRTLFIKIGIAGALVVLVFALLQVFVLPRDFLKYIGYGPETISPYLTIDENNLFIRINSTLRGPNPLGAYAGLALAMIISALSKLNINGDRRRMVISAVLLSGGTVALWSSYSRTALIGSLAAVAIVLLVNFYKKLSTRTWVVIGLVLLVASGGLFLIKDSSLVSNVLLHNNPNGGSLVKSDESHVGSLNSGFNQLVNQPVGAGVGSTGSASLLGDYPEVIENQYLFIAHEAGWLGLALFMFIFTAIMYRLWNRRRDWFALGVFAGGVSLALVGILLPVWADDTVSIVWWGLAAIAVIPPHKADEIFGE